MTITTGIDIGSCAVKTVLLRHGETKNEVLAQRCDRLRHRDVRAVVRESYDTALQIAGLQADDIAYVATTGEGELVDFRTGHFYGMTAHARGGLELIDGASAVLDIGALHARAIVIDPARASSWRTSPATSEWRWRRSARSPCRPTRRRNAPASARCWRRPT
jgi:benzoyl-CoA reductase subunit D